MGIKKAPTAKQLANRQKLIPASPPPKPLDTEKCDERYDDWVVESHKLLLGHLATDIVPSTLEADTAVSAVPVRRVIKDGVTTFLVLQTTETLCKYSEIQSKALRIWITDSLVKIATNTPRLLWESRNSVRFGTCTKCRSRQPMITPGSARSKCMWQGCNGDLREADNV